MLKRFLILMLAVGMAAVCFAKVETIAVNTQKMVFLGDPVMGEFFIDGPVADVEGLMESLALDPSIPSARREFFAALLDDLAGMNPEASVMIQPLGKGDLGSESVNDNLPFDAYINQDHPDTNYGGDGVVNVGCYYDYTAFGNREDRGLWGYYSCPSNSLYIIDAKMWVYINSTYVGVDRMFCVWRISSSWSEYSVTWNNQPSYANADCTAYTGGQTGWTSFSAYLPVYYACDVGYSNYGLALRGDAGWATSSTCPCWPWPLDDREYLVVNSYEGNSSRMAYVTIQYWYVDLSDFSVEPEGDKIVVSWKTSLEENNAGWNLYRSADGGEYVKLNDALIEPYQYDYEYIDRDVKTGTEYCYELEAVDLDGSRQTFGPECVVFGASSGDGDAADLPAAGYDDDTAGMSATGGCGGF